MSKLKIYFSLAVYLIVLSAFSQQNKLLEISSANLINSGTLIDSNNDVDGYYFYYGVDKLKKGKAEYAIKMLDQNLNEIANKSHIDDRDTRILKSKFNNQALMFAMINEDERFFKLLAFDRTGEKSVEMKIPVEKKEIKDRYIRNILLPIDNKGFLFNYKRDFKRPGYTLKYVPTDGGKGWEFSSPDEDKMHYEINPMAANKNLIIAVEYEYKSSFSKNVNINLLGFDINTGKLKFKKEFKKEEDPRFITNVNISDDQFVLLGEYYEKKDNVVKDESQGLFAQILDMSGNVISDSKINWETSIENKMPNEIGKDKNRGFVFFNDIIKTNTGEYYCIGERYRKTVSFNGIMAGTSYTQLTITDAILFKFDKDFNLQNIKAYEKGKSRVESIIQFGSPQYNAYYMNFNGAFDYEFTQIDRKRNRFYSIFIDYERLKGEKNKFAYKALIYNDGEITEDKIYLQNDNKNSTWVLPGKLGHVLMIEYNKKEEKLDIHLEKLNL